MILQHWHAVTEFQKEMNPFKKAWIIMICNNQSALMCVLLVNQYMHDMQRNDVTNKRCLYKGIEFHVGWNKGSNFFFPQVIYVQ